MEVSWLKRYAGWWGDEGNSRKEQLGRWYLNKDVKDLEELAI